MVVLRVLPSAINGDNFGTVSGVVGRDCVWMFGAASGRLGAREVRPLTGPLARDPMLPSIGETNIQNTTICTCTHATYQFLLDT